MHIPRGERGATLLDAVVGSALMLVVFVGIAGAFQLTILAISNNKARAGAIALANERIEYVRSLPYSAVGTVGGVPVGSIEADEIVSLNNVNYTRRTLIAYEDDPADGLGGADENGIITDYKAVKVELSWLAREGEHTIELVTRISPPTIETSVPGGVLSINVLDASFAPVSSAEVRIVNASLTPPIDLTRFTNASGVAQVLGAPPGAGYEISVTKPGYSRAQTYGATATNTNPVPAHLGVALDTTTAATFAIDVTGEKTIVTLRPILYGTTTESFVSPTGIASSSNVVVSGGDILLTGSEGSYPAWGGFVSNAVSTSSLITWNEFAWNASEPTDTAVVMRVYDGSGTVLVPDAQIPGNSSGLTVSPVDLTQVSTSTFPTLSVYGTLVTTDASSTPRVTEWYMSYATGPHSLPNVDFTLTSAKVIGTDPGGSLIYKYDEEHSSGATGVLTLSGLEWDSYTIRVASTTGFDIASACAPQPETLEPGASHTTTLTLVAHTDHSLLVDIKNSNGDAIPDASVVLSRAPFSEALPADSCGNAFFDNLASGTVGGSNAYSIDVTASGYQQYLSSSVNVSGTSHFSIIMSEL